MIVAHASHWLVNLMFALPAVGFIGWLGYMTIKNRHHDSNSGEGE